MEQKKYTRSNPFMALMKERYHLNEKGSKKTTLHIVVDISGSGMEYSPGDSLAVLAYNDPVVAEKTLELLGASGDETITHKKSGEQHTLRDYLTRCATITRVPRKLVALVAEATNDEELAAIPADKEKFCALYDTYHVWDFLERHPATLDIQAFCDALPAITPRLYSIASSQDAVGHNKVHLAVALIDYTTNGHHRYGVCSHYLCDVAPLHDTIPVYIQKAHGFALPDDDSAAIIMVGPGTGVAPFRAFVQERMHRDAPGKNWLFYGDWTEKYDFCYGDYWHDLEAAGKLRLDTAFSRDQDYKIYVQHKILENGSDIWQWLNDGAYFYVCGDAKRMAKDVEKALHSIAMEFGHLSDGDATAFLADMKKSHRYQQDIY